MSGQVLYVVPPLAIGWLLMEWANERYVKCNPAVREVIESAEG